MIFCRMQNGVVCLYLFDDQKKTCTDLHLHINGNPVQANHAKHMHVSIQVTAFALRQALRPTPKMVPQTSGDAKARIFWGKQTRITANTMELHKDANGNCHFGGHCISATPGDAGLSHLNACRVRATVPTATPMKVGTATQLRDENLGKPQMPWPLVQPRPTRVPIPTKMPAAM